MVKHLNDIERDLDAKGFDVERLRANSKRVHALADRLSEFLRQDTEQHLAQQMAGLAQTCNNLARNIAFTHLGQLDDSSIPGHFSASSWFAATNMIQAAERHMITQIKDKVSVSGYSALNIAGLSAALVTVVLECTWGVRKGEKGDEDEG